MGYGYYGFFYDSTYILVLIGVVITLFASARVNSTFRRFSNVAARCGMSGAEVARQILHSQGLYDVSVEHISGELTDHFDPRSKRVRLSDAVYASRSLAAISVAAHECGHACQHDEEYFPLKLRSAIVPVANFGSKLGLPIIIAGVIFSYFQPLITLGIVLFSFGVFFQLVTLPVEFDASRRALAILGDLGLVETQEMSGAKKVLSAAAMTYVASAAAAILQLLRLILLFGGRRRDRD